MWLSRNTFQKYWHNIIVYKIYLMIKKDILIIDDDWRFTEFVQKWADTHDLTLDQTSEWIGAVQFLQKEKREYVCIILDGKFPLWHPAPSVPPKLKAFGTLHEKNNPKQLTGLTLLRYLREKEWEKNGVLWVLSSNTFNRDLNWELKDWWIEEKDIMYMEDKHYRGPQEVEEVFNRVKARR